MRILRFSGPLPENSKLLVGIVPNPYQKTVLDAMESTLGTPNLSQAIRIKKLQEDGRFRQEKIEEFLSEVKQKDADRVIFKNEQLYRYFPSYYTAEQMKREILTLCVVGDVPAVF